MLWEVAVLLVAITFMAVNIWSIVINTMVLKKFAPLWDRLMKMSDKFMKEIEDELFDNED